MRIIFRTDSSNTIGSGHLMRCLTLAARLQKEGSSVTFICRRLIGNLIQLVGKKGFETFTLPFFETTSNDPVNQGKCEKSPDVNRETDVDQCREIINKSGPVDWIIVDHYGLDYQWEKAMRPFSDNIMVIDDLANRRHDCDLLLDQNLFDHFENRYDDLVPGKCLKLLGPRYTMLRPEFLRHRDKLRRRNGRIERILIFLGAADSNGITAIALEAVGMLGRPDLTVDVVVGDCNPNSDSIREFCQTIPGGNFHRQVDNMADLMAAADIAIGAGGSTTWERCCLGLPTFFIATTDNEIEVSQTCDRAGIGKYLGSYGEISSQLICDELAGIMEKPETLRLWGENAARLVDGQGIERVCQSISSFAKVSKI